MATTALPLAVCAMSEVARYARTRCARLPDMKPRVDSAHRGNPRGSAEDRG